VRWLVALPTAPLRRTGKSLQRRGRVADKRDKERGVQPWGRIIARPRSSL
jgi:hypothetical protein